jgi:hypothetical protein
MLFVRKMFGWGLLTLIAAVAIALFPSNYEIVGMGDDSITASDDQSPQQ